MKIEQVGKSRRPARVAAGSRLLVATVAAAALAALAAAPEGSAPLDAVADRLRARLETAARESTALVVVGQPLYAPAVVSRFYEQRTFRPAWLGPGTSFERVRELLDAIRGADRHGLEPSDYHLRTLQVLLWRGTGTTLGADAEADLLVDLELVATDAFLVYGAHLLAGRIDPERLTPDWRASPPERDLARTLEEAIASGSVRAGLDGLLPTSPGYRRLQAALERYRELAAAGGWRALPPGTKLGRGATGERVRRLRQRLAASGDLDDAGADPAAAAFDDALDLAVRAFQKRHGLEVDGAVGPGTQAALDVPAAERATQIALHLERWRWLPRDLGRRHLAVNVPAFELRVIENEQVVMAMRAVVGRPYRSTPILSANMTHLVVSPYWNVPPSMAVEDVLPAVKANPAYLAERGIRAFWGWGAEEREVDPASVDWTILSGRSFPYRFRQEPGDQNMLGRIKFISPNPHDVYLHDTPRRELFEEVRRDFSSGCIRIERAFDLAEYVLRGDSRWSRDALIAAAAVDAETAIVLPERIPVHILYRTSWVDDGEVDSSSEPRGASAAKSSPVNPLSAAALEFREDIYDRDPALAAALSEPPPGRRRGATR